jgi:hypothetical protein
MGGEIRHGTIKQIHCRRLTAWLHIYYENLEKPRFPLSTQIDGKPGECIRARISLRRAEIVVECSELKFNGCLGQKSPPRTKTGNGQFQYVQDIQRLTMYFRYRSDTCHSRQPDPYLLTETLSADFRPTPDLHRRPANDNCYRSPVDAAAKKRKYKTPKKQPEGHIVIHGHEVMS